MFIYAIYFKDKDVWHVRVSSWYDYNHNYNHLRINGKVVNRGENYGGSDYTVEGRELKVEAGREHQEIQYYLNRESKEQMPVSVYKEQMASFRTPDGGYKDLESEYACRKMMQTYIPVHFTYYEYDEVPVVIEEAEFHPDKYTKCEGWIKRDDSKEVPDFFVFRFDKWAFCNDLVKRLMEEYGVPRIEDPSKRNTADEFYALSENTNSYKWLELCKDEYFIRAETMFGMDNKGNVVYCAYSEVEGMQKGIETRLREKIESYLDNHRRVSIKKRDISEIEGDILALRRVCENKNKTKSSISADLDAIYNKLRASHTKVGY